MIFEGLLVDLVPFGQAFREREVGWINGPMREWWLMDGLLTQAAQDRRRAHWESLPGGPQRVAVFGLQTKDGTPIGTFALLDINAAHRTAHIGAGIGDPAYWSGGYGSDAMLLIVEYAFGWLDLRRLWLGTLSTNFRAQRQVEKCAFTREATRRRLMLDIHGQYQDWVFYGLLREEWPGREVMIERLGLREKAVARGNLQEEQT